MSWNYSILLEGHEAIADIIISTATGQPPLDIPTKSSFRFLSLVETALIPLHLAIGPHYSVHTSTTETERWFRNLLLHPELTQDSCWWESSRVDSPLGILVGVPTDDGDQTSPPRVTELLFYASRGTNQDDRPPTPPCSSPHLQGTKAYEGRSAPILSLHALALSSDLLGQSAATEPTPPTSPTAKPVDIDAVFLPHPFLNVTKPINQPPTRKRKSASDVFQEASERRRQKVPRKGGGDGVSAAAAPAGVTPDAQASTLHRRRRSSSNSQANALRLQSRPPSRSPSLAPPQQLAPAVKRGSTLSHVQSAADASEISDIEARNKDTISRIVMAGMRLYGLSQSKRRKSRAGSAAASSAVDDAFDEQEAERRKDEEFKLIYHQVFKGTCFAFRAVLAKLNPHSFPDAIRDVADRLLAIFCNDPLCKDESGAFHLGAAGEVNAFGMDDSGHQIAFQ